MNFKAHSFTFIIIGGIALITLQFVYADHADKMQNWDTSINSDFGSITGTVSGLEPEDIAGAYVEAWSANPDSNFYSKGISRIDSSFQYRIDDLSPGQYYVLACADGYAPLFYGNVENIDEALPVSVDSNMVTENIDFQMIKNQLAAGSISGQVLQERDLSPITRATVYVYSTNFSDYFSSAFTDETGQYKLKNLKSGTYYAEVSAPGFISEIYDNVHSFDQAATITVSEPNETAGIDFVLSLGGKISGTVIDDNESPITGVLVEAVHAVNSDSVDIAPARSTRGYAYTDKDGHYEITGLLSGPYLARASISMDVIGWAECFKWYKNADDRSNADTLYILQGETTENIDFQLTTTPVTATISGLVQSANGQPVTSALIQINHNRNYDKTEPWSSRSRFYSSTYSDSCGFYKIDQIPPGTYTIFCSYWDNEHWGQQWYEKADSFHLATPLTLGKDDILTGIDFTLNIRPIYGTLTGTVMSAGDQTPITNAYVEISPSYFEKTFAPLIWSGYNTTTDENGMYTIEKMMEGEYFIAVYGDGGFAYYKDAVVPKRALPVRITPGEVTTADVKINLRHDGNGIITGKVSSELDNSVIDSIASDEHQIYSLIPNISKSENIPIAVVIAKPVNTVMSWPESEMFYTTVTNELGEYTLKGLPSSEFYVMSFAPYHIMKYYDNVFDPALATLVKVNETEPTTGIDFTLSPAYFLFDTDLIRNLTNGRIHGLVKDINDQPVPGTTVYLLNENGDAIQYATTGTNGAYELIGIQEGTYHLQAVNTGYETSYNGDTDSFEESTPIEIQTDWLEINMTLTTKKQTPVGSKGQTGLPRILELHGNFPNPFNPETQISFTLPKQSRVTIDVFNHLGQRVARIFEGELNSGLQNVQWNGLDHFDQHVGSGIYVYRIKSESEVRSGKMMLLK